MWSSRQSRFIKSKIWRFGKGWNREIRTETFKRFICVRKFFFTNIIFLFAFLTTRDHFSVTLVMLTCWPDLLWNNQSTEHSSVPLLFACSNNNSSNWEIVTGKNQSQMSENVSFTIYSESFFFLDSGMKTICRRHLCHLNNSKPSEEYR